MSWALFHEVDGEIELIEFRKFPSCWTKSDVLDHIRNTEGRKRVCAIPEGEWHNVQ